MILSEKRGFEELASFLRMSTRHIYLILQWQKERGKFVSHLFLRLSHPDRYFFPSQTQTVKQT